MLGNYYLGNKKFELRKMKFDKLMPHEVKIKNMAAGICGTDVHIYEGEKGASNVSLPVVLGHEYSGIVEDVGTSVKGIKIGDRVCVDPNIYCGICKYCKKGKKQFCENLKAIGVNMNGGFANYSVVDEKAVYILDENVSFKEGAMAEPLACCIHGIENINIKIGDTVLVVGGGTIGLIMVQLSKLSGASKVILSEPVKKRRDVGIEVGADYSFDPIKEPLKKQIDEKVGNEGVDVVIECSGKVSALKDVFENADRGSEILLFGVPDPKAQFSIKLYDVFYKELKICGSFINPDTQKKAVHMLNSKRIELKKLITHMYPLEKLKEAIIMQTKNESIKVMIGKEGSEDENY